MKPLLRTLLAMDAVIVLVLGLLFLLTPWLAALYAPLSGFESAPALIGQLLGVTLLGMAALQAQAMAKGHLTGAVARVTGHTLWIGGVVLLVWELALGQPAGNKTVQYSAVVVGIALLLLGLGQARKQQQW